MQRGILTVTKEEAISLVENLDMQRISQTPLYSKLSSLLNNQQEYKILLSEDEIEIIMDDIGPAYDNPTLCSILEKITILMNSFREQA